MAKMEETVSVLAKQLDNKPLDVPKPKRSGLVKKMCPFSKPKNNIITEEMEYCAIRENEGREKLIGKHFKKEDLVTAEFVRQQVY